MRSLRYSFIHRKQTKREMRKLWIARINAAVRPYDLSYSKFMYGLKLAGITVNRKMLSEIAATNPDQFKNLVEVSSKAIVDSKNA